jgi:hypothetical protein
MKKLVIIPALCLAIGCTAQKTNKDVVPEERGGIYSLTIDNQVLEINPQIGGRITSLKLDGKDFFTGKDVNADYWGSTFWPSPQKVWGGPTSALDKQPYAVSIVKNVIKMVSKPDPKSGFVFTKEMSANASNRSFTIKYTITNQSAQAQKVAPWEVTRVHPNGLAFYPKGQGERWGNIANLAEDIDGITWFAHQKEKIPATHNKFFADGAEGWVAQVNDQIIFVKKFPNISAEKAAPSEAEVEIYTNPDKTYVEIEQQGAYQELQPGASSSWEVTWFLRKLPATIKTQPGSAALVTYVRKLIK